MIEFEWDVSKELMNVRKHGVTFMESSSCFLDPQGIQLLDKRRFYGEDRYYWIGKSDQDRILTTWFTYRGSKVRIIGCAQWRKMRRYYYEAAKKK